MIHLNFKYGSRVFAKRACTNLRLFRLNKYCFCSKNNQSANNEQESADNKELIKRKHETEINRRIRRLLKREIFPIFFISVFGVAAYIFWDQILNLFNFKRASEKELREIGRKVSTLVKYSHHSKTIDQERIEHELVENVYKHILNSLHVKALKQDITIYSADEKNIFMLPNGSLFISDALLNSFTDVRQLIFLILRQFSLLKAGCLATNLSE